MEKAGRWRYRVTTVKEGFISKITAGDEAQGEGFIAVNIPVHARFETRGTNLVGSLEDLRGLSVVIASFERQDIGFCKVWFLAEFFLDMLSSEAGSLEYVQNISPRAKKFLQRDFSLEVRDVSSRAVWVSFEISIWWTR